MQKIDKGYWGEPMEEEAEEGESQAGRSERAKEDSDNDEAKIDFGQQIEALHQKRDEQERKSGISSVVDGLETPFVDLRKIALGKDDQFEYSSNERPLYQVLEQIQAEKKPGQIFGGHTYQLPENNK